MEESNQLPAESIAPERDLLLASRGLRLGGALLDGLIFAAILFPIAYVSGAWQTYSDSMRRGELPPFGFMLMWSAVGLIIFVILQGYPLVKDGQTWGKKMVYTKIVTMDGKLPSVKQLCVRYAILNYVGAIPIISWINLGLIFRKDKRCGHDLAAGTQVIDVEHERPR